MIPSLLTFLLLLSCSAGLSAQTSAGASLAGEGQATASLTGRVVDGTGAAIEGAAVSLLPVRASSGAGTKAVTDASGSFSVSGLESGQVSLSVAAPSFSKLNLTVVVSAGQTKDLGSLTLAIAPKTSSVQVTLTQQEIATEQLKQEEQQRLLGVIPNYFVTYLPDAVPLTSKQKFGLTAKFNLDPASFVITGVIAGIEQANNSYAGYGQGAQGYGKRYGGAYGNFLIGNLLGSAIFPSIFKQDPRYFVKGEGTVRTRLLYALMNSVVRKGDNRRWQPDYSGILGDLGAGAISNLYYPSANRNGAALTFKNAGIGIAVGAAVNVVQEFFFRKITPKAP